jgi:hypothetical protein
MGAPFDASVQVAASAPLTSTQTVQAKVSVSAPAAAMVTSPNASTKKPKKADSPFLVPSGSDRFFEGGSSNWGTDEHSAALQDAAKHEFSALADKLLTEMESRVTEIHVSTRADSAAETPQPKEADDSKRRKTKADESSEEEPVVLPSPQAPGIVAGAPKPKPKPKPATDGDLSVALKKPPAKKKAK